MIPLKQLVFLLALLLLRVATATEEPQSPDFTLLIPMRDGKELPTDIYLPPTDDLKPHPCILMRNPSGRRAKPWVRYSALSKLGYVVAIQDARNCLDLEGCVMPYYSDGWGEEQDGYDTVEWLANCPFTNGDIGTIGFSAPGITQLLMAPSAPPSLKCQYIGVAAANLYSQAVFNGGQVLKNQVEGWWAHHGNNPDTLAFVVDQRDYNEFWDRFNTPKVAHRVNVPALHYGGWFDVFLQGTIDGFVSRHYDGAEGARGKQKLLIGPWTHSWPRNTKIGDFDVPTPGHKPPHDYSPQAWFAHHLKGEGDLMADLPAVTYYVMGPFDGSPSSGNRWKSSNEWPIPSEPRTLYLSMTGALAEKIPSVSGTKKYRYDPANPVPTLGGRNLFLESGVKDQRSIEDRHDVLVFTTDPLSHDLEITGQVIAKLYFSSDCTDTDVAVRLTDVYPDGRSMLITDGIYRLGHGRSKGEIIASQHPQEVEVDLAVTSMVFARGHKIRITVTSSNYPRYEKNLNVALGDEKHPNGVIATNRLWVGPKTPSRLILPVVKN